MPLPNLVPLYAPLIGWTALGWVLGRLLPQAAPAYLGKFLFWVGVPVGIVAFLRHVQLSSSLWVAPVVAWTAILLGFGLSWLLTVSRLQAGGRVDRALHWLKRLFPWLYWLDTHQWSQRTQGSFLLASMVGNTGYIGYPISLALVGPQYFAWALFYDMLGSTPGSYGLGVVLASRFGGNSGQTLWQSSLVMLKNPALWSFGLGLGCRDLWLPFFVEESLHRFALFVVALSLVLVGMRLSQLSSFNSMKPALLSLMVKMLIVPIVLGAGLWAVGLTGLVHRAILLQMAMPPAFATLVLAETYELDSEMAVTALVAGCLGLLLMLPFWLWLFSG